MQVTDLEAIPLEHDLGEGNGLGSSRGTTQTRFTTLVRLTTDEGAVGWGEAFAPGPVVEATVDDPVTGKLKVVTAYGAETRYVDVTVERFAGDVLGTWTIEPEWVEGLLSYRLSEEDFSERVLDSLSETADGESADGTGEGSA